MKDRFIIVTGDITTMQVDAIVNAANNTLLGGGGVDGAIHRAAGPELLEECRKIGGCPTGEARMTKGYHLPAKYVIHTVGPVWNGGGHEEDEKLGACYLHSLQIAKNHNLKTIAFPSISTGAYRFPIEKAAKIAVKTIFTFLQNNELPEFIYMVCFSENATLAYEKAKREVLVI